jgi:pimeloyl-ACP methyl ester carboxylesterase/DNA-binding winged helix-turn-helix (wHTH) protein
MPLDPVIAFDPFRLDPAGGQLWRDNVAVPLTPKAFAVLEFLALRAGRLVSKRELLDAVWPGVFVGDAVLKVAIREVRKALGDHPRTPLYIETAHRRGYRFIAPIVSAAPGAPAASTAATGASVPTAHYHVPKVHYARSGAVNIAYEVIGSGPIDLVFVMGWVSHLEYFWNEPSFARFLTRLAAKARLILFDKRGTGLSDPVPISQLPTLEERLDDVRAVMEAAGSQRAVLFGVSEGGPLCTLFAATYPEKTEALIMVGCYARRLVDVDYPWGQTRDQRDQFCNSLIELWGGPVGIEERAPSMRHDAAFREWWASYLRMGASPGAAVALTRMNAEIDVRDVLPSVRVPTLVLHRRGDRCLKVEEGRYLASRIPNAEFVELDGDDHLPFVGEQDEILDEVERFLARSRVPTLHERVLSTLLVVRANAGDADREHLHRVFEREVSAYRGRVASLGDPWLVASFDGPGRAVRCGWSVAAVARRSHIDVHAGIHVGECDLAEPDGPLVAIAAAIADAARPSEVLVSRTVVDLVPGSGLQFADRGLMKITGSDLPVFAVAGV